MAALKTLILIKGKACNTKQRTKINLNINYYYINNTNTIIIAINC